MINENNDNLSDAGADRREQMLGELLIAMRQVHQRRRMRKRIAIAAAPMIAVVVLAVIWYWAQSNSTPRIPNRMVLESEIGDRGTEAEPLAVRQSVIIVRVQTDPTILDRYRSSAVPRARMMDDETLLSALAQMNMPAGLIRSEGRTWLTREVADPIAADPAS